MTTKKMSNFFSNCFLGDHPTTVLPGVGPVLGSRLSKKGFEKAFTVAGVFLLFKKDQELFEMWMTEEAGANAKQARDCYLGLEHWAAHCLWRNRKFLSVLKVVRFFWKRFCGSEAEIGDVWRHYFLLMAIGETVSVEGWRLWSMLNFQNCQGLANQGCWKIWFSPQPLDVWNDLKGPQVIKTS